MAIMYIVAGILHFVYPKAYMRIMPRYLPAHRILVYLSGLAEIVLGLGLCFRGSKNTAVYGIILMLLAFMAVHIYMLTEKKAGLGIPKWVLYLRIPLQFGLIFWAWWYLRF